jgi:hypothetical protein
MPVIGAIGLIPKIPETLFVERTDFAVLTTVLHPNIDRGYCVRGITSRLLIAR